MLSIARRGARLTQNISLSISGEAKKKKKNARKQSSWAAERHLAILFTCRSSVFGFCLNAILINQSVYKTTLRVAKKFASTTLYWFVSSTSYICEQFFLFFIRFPLGFNSLSQALREQSRREVGTARGSATLNHVDRETSGWATVDWIRS